MAIGNDEVKYKRSLGIRQSKERKSFKFSLQAASSQSLETNKSVAEGKSYVKKCDLLKKYNRREKNAEKDREPEKNDSLRSETRSADQTDNRASPEQFRGNEKSAFNEKEQVNCHVSDQEGCLACTITSETQAGAEVNVRQVPSFDSEDGQQLEQGRTKISNHEGAEKEYHDSFKARVAALRRETYMLSCELQKHATACMELSDANRLLMHELKEMCEPHVIQILEAKNPDNHPQTN